MIGNRAKSVLRALRSAFRVPKWTTANRDPFKTLVETIISQNTTGGNAANAFEKLSKQFEIMPEVLANAEANRIEECLKEAGLYRNKARTIKQVSRIILEKFDGDLKPVLSSSLEEARKTLQQLPGVGPKTAMLFCFFAQITRPFQLTRTLTECQKGWV